MLEFNWKRVIVAGLLLAGLPSYAQSTKDKLLAVEAGLNDASAIVRLSTLDEALADDSKAVREFALTQAFASADSTVRSLAVNHFFKTKKSFSVRIDKSEALATEEARRLSAGEKLDSVESEFRSSYLTVTLYRPAVNYLIGGYDEDSGVIQGLCLTGTSKPDERYTFIGNVTGDSVALQHRCSVSGMVDKCRLDLQLAENAPEFVGTMQCEDSRFSAAASIKLN